MITTEKEKIGEGKDKDNVDVSTFLSNLNSAIDYRASSKQENKINRFYYTIGSLNILLEQDLKVENISHKVINVVPHSKEWQEGIISVRGTIMPVINLHKFLQDKIDTGKKNKKSNQYFLMIDHAEHTPITLLVDKLPEMIDLSSYEKKEPADNAPNWHEQTLEHGASRVIKVSHKNLLNQLIELQ